jgi:hypothetical protein
LLRKFCLAGIVQADPGVLPQCIQQAVAGALLVRLHRYDQRLIDQSLQDVERVGSAERHGARKVEWAGENRQPSEQFLFGRVQ